jgi:predicted lactoylglutathione lyase
MPLEPNETCARNSTSPFPPACPEVPVAELIAAVAYYRDRLGFVVDWSDEALGLAGVSRRDARLFLSDAQFRAQRGNRAPIVLWFNPSSRAEVDAIYAQWHAAGARIESAPEAKPYKLYEFFAQDLDGNVLRVFYDFAWEER